MPPAGEPIRSRSNPLVRRLRALKERGPEGGLILLEGVRLLEEALAAGIELREVAASPRAAGDARAGAILGEIERRGVPLRLLDERLLASLSELESSQGLLALAEPPRFEESAPPQATPLVLVAVGVQNPGNLGALLRTAEAAGATGAYLADGCAEPLAWKALRGAMGSAFRLPHWRASSAAACRALQERGVRLVAGVTSGTQGAVSYESADYRGPTAFLVGSEGAGLPSALLAAADRRVSVPLHGAVESLNVAVAAGVLLFEAARQRRGPER
jgi:TrmH family RNA methyltransferase